MGVELSIPWAGAVRQHKVPHHSPCGKKPIPSPPLHTLFKMTSPRNQRSGNPHVVRLKLNQKPHLCDLKGVQLQQSVLPTWRSSLTAGSLHGPQSRPALNVSCPRGQDAQRVPVWMGPHPPALTPRGSRWPAGLVPSARDATEDTALPPTGMSVTEAAGDRPRPALPTGPSAPACLSPAAAVGEPKGGGKHGSPASPPCLPQRRHLEGAHHSPGCQADTTVPFWSLVSWPGALLAGSPLEAEF